MIIFMILKNNKYDDEHMLVHQDKHHNQDNNANYNEHHIMMKKMKMIKIRRMIRIKR